MKLISAAFFLFILFGFVAVPVLLLIDGQQHCLFRGGSIEECAR